MFGFRRSLQSRRAARHLGAAAVTIFLCLAMAPARADLEADFQKCRADILRIGDSPKTPWETYCLGLSYRKAATQGYAPAQNNLGLFYEIGRGVREDWIQAAHWYRLSADQGNARGQFAMGRAYQFGIGVPQDRQEAIRWFERAASRGDDQANYWVNQLRSRGNFIGFRDDTEQRIVVGNRLRTDTQLVFAEPRGQVFRNSADRDRYILKLRDITNYNEAYAAWSRASDRYAACKRGETGDSYCSAPGPPP